MKKRIKIPKQMEPSAPSAIPREHEFKGVNREEWEQVVFEEAIYFTVTRRHGRFYHNVERKEFKDFLAAIQDAVTGPPLPIPMVYAVTANERFVLLPKDQWVRLLNEYAARNPEK